MSHGPFSAVKCPVCSREETYAPAPEGPREDARTRLEDRCSHGARTVFVATECPVCLESPAGPPMVRAFFSLQNDQSREQARAVSQHETLHSDAFLHSLLPVIVLPTFYSKISLGCGHLICTEDFQLLGGKRGVDASLSEGVRDPSGFRPSNEARQGMSDFGSEGDGNSSRGAGPREIVVSGAGIQEVNGVYRRDGCFQGACRYVMEGHWNGARHQFYIYCCNVSNNARYWYISIPPGRGRLGTSLDIDFYFVAVEDWCRVVPPRLGWQKANSDFLLGRDPSVPTLEGGTRSGVQRIDELGGQTNQVSIIENVGPCEISVTGAGIRAVNGSYHQAGYFQGACRYAKVGRWNGTLNTFYIFCCQVSNYSNHWYISIAPSGCELGTGTDIDFYTAPVGAGDNLVPPRERWAVAQNGAADVPTLAYRTTPRSHSNA
jgi:hypothetical protein